MVYWVAPVTSAHGKAKEAQDWAVKCIKYWRQHLSEELIAHEVAVNIGGPITKFI